MREKLWRSQLLGWIKPSCSTFTQKSFFCPTWLCGSDNIPNEKEIGNGLGHGDCSDNACLPSSKRGFKTIQTVIRMMTLLLGIHCLSLDTFRWRNDAAYFVSKSYSHCSNSPLYFILFYNLDELVSNKYVGKRTRLWLLLIFRSCCRKLRSLDSWR